MNLKLFIHLIVNLNSVFLKNFKNILIFLFISVTINSLKIWNYIINLILIFICLYFKLNFCEKKFTRKDSLNKHIKSSCKNKKTDNEMDNLKELLSNAFKEIEKIKMENELLKNYRKQLIE